MRKFNITDHCVLRYIERVYGIDLGEVRAKIFNDLKDFPIEGVKDFKYTRGRRKYVVVEGCVVTVITKKGQAS